MFISVLLPAPFSPSRQWISAGSITRSMASLATSEPNRLVSPASSRCMADSLPESRRTPGSAGPRPLPLGLRLRLRGDGDLAGDDVGLDLVDLGLQLGRDLAVELVVRRQAGAAVLQSPYVRGVVEGVVEGGLDRVLHGHVHALVDAAHQHAAVLGGRDAAVGVDPDRVHLATA